MTNKQLQLTELIQGTKDILANYMYRGTVGEVTTCTCTLYLLQTSSYM